jgi:hypothetical protein
MRFSLTGLIRLCAFLGVVSSIAAIGVARLVPPEEAEWRPYQSRYAAINGFILSPRQNIPRLLDTATGECRPLALSKSDLLDNLGFSSWRNRGGELEAVGRWVHRSVGEGPSVVEQVGIGRFTVPGGEMLELVELDIIPMGRPCWFPDPPARILFPSGDCQLYRYTFSEGRGERAGKPVEKATPQPLIWRCAPPGVGQVILGDPVWLPDRCRARRLIVTLSYLEHRGSRQAFRGPELWWLQLDRDGTAIESAKRLIEPGPMSSLKGEHEERLPQCAVTSDGQTIVAFLTRPKHGSSWSLRVAFLRVDPTTGAIIAEMKSDHALVEDCVCGAPALSADGRWIYVVRKPDQAGQARLERFSIQDSLGVAPPAQNVSMSAAPSRNDTGP